MDDVHWQFLTSVPRHPVLVVRGMNNRHQPIVTLAPGSSTLSPDRPETVLWVRPDQVEPAGALTVETRFFLHWHRRFAVSKLGKRGGKLGPAKHAEMLARRTATV